MSDYISEISGEIRKERITAPDFFADDIMKRIAVEKRGGLEAMSATSRILLFAMIFVVYSSLGVLVGIQGYKSMAPGSHSKFKGALEELMDTHHLAPDNMHDQLFRHFYPAN
jgi:hypothetical protein